MIQRRCIGCWQIKDRKNLIKVTNAAGKPVISPNSDTFGRSVYLCYNESCIEAALKKKKLEKFLKTPLSEELKGQLFDELRNS